MLVVTIVVMTTITVIVTVDNHGGGCDGSHGSCDGNGHDGGGGCNTLTNHTRKREIQRLCKYWTVQLKMT